MYPFLYAHFSEICYCFFHYISHTCGISTSLSVGLLLLRAIQSRTCHCQRVKFCAIARSWQVDRIFYIRFCISNPSIQQPRDLVLMSTLLAPTDTYWLGSAAPSGYKSYLSVAGPSTSLNLAGLYWFCGQEEKEGRKEVCVVFQESLCISFEQRGHLYLTEGSGPFR